MKDLELAKRAYLADRDNAELQERYWSLLQRYGGTDVELRRRRISRKQLSELIEKLEPIAHSSARPDDILASALIILRRQSHRDHELWPRVVNTPPARSSLVYSGGLRLLDVLLGTQGVHESNEGMFYFLGVPGDDDVDSTNVSSVVYIPDNDELMVASLSEMYDEEERIIRDTDPMDEDYLDTGEELDQWWTRQ